MKKIGIDARLYSQTGVGVYIRNLLYYLDKIYAGGDQFYVYLMEADYHRVSFRKKNFIKKKVSYYWHSIAEQTGFLKLLNGNDLDLIHFTYFSYPIFYQRKFIATVHDLTPYYFETGKASTKPKLVYKIKHAVFKTVLKNQIRHSSKIITPSRTVKNQIVNEFGEKYNNKIIPIYEGLNYELINVKENASLKQKYPGKFFIYVGNFYPHKNVDNLIKAFFDLPISNYRLILIGPKDYFLNRLLRFNIKLEQSNRIVFHQTDSANDLVFFYRNAQALIHPSLSEGFGLPLVEAAYFNLPVIASNIPVFKEILGDQFLSFNPESVADIKEKITHFLNNKPVFGFSQLLKKYSFEEMTQRTLTLYKNLLNK